MNRGDPMTDSRLERALAAHVAEPVDLEAGRTEVHRRLHANQAPTLVAARFGRSKKALVASVLVALGLGGAGVAVATRYVTKTDDGTRLEQLFAGGDATDGWRVEVTRGEKPGEYCVTTNQGDGGGGLCDTEWALNPDGPTAFFTQMRGRTVDGEPANLMIVVSDPSRKLVVGSLVDGRRDIAPLRQLPGVVDAEAVIRGHRFQVYLAVVSRRFSEPSGDETHDLFYER